jgi:prepilin-type N-terminal cleavage/methylation domain-containing protein
MNKKSGFTIIELMIVITMISIISLATYMPYAHHQKKTLIKQAAREITQSLSEARNLATNGLSTLSGASLHVGLYFPPAATQIDYYTST